MVERNVGRCWVDHQALGALRTLPLVARHERACIDRELPPLNLLLLLADVLSNLILETAEGCRIYIAHVTLVVACRIRHGRLDHGTVGQVLCFTRLVLLHHFVFEALLLSGWSWHFFQHILGH